MLSALVSLTLKLVAVFVLTPLAVYFAIVGYKMSRMSQEEIRAEFGPSESQIEFSQFKKGARHD